ncbi:MAG: MoaD/ThiS family protein, partial [Flavobacteriaceae bacterium]
MNLTIKYFGLIAEITNCSEEQMEFLGKTVLDLKEQLFQKHPALKLKDFQIAQDNELVENETEITGIEIALLPPFAGG